jgi:hypothetical protein
MPLVKVLAGDVLARVSLLAHEACLPLPSGWVKPVLSGLTRP